jgi:SAM-dependent methyltransferase
MPDDPKLYNELAGWFHLLTRPEDYHEEAAFAAKLLADASVRRVRTVLELGAGGGNNAFHLKATFQMTLTDLSGAMLDNSRQINPECEHVQGDMRTLRLNRKFDAVFIHDAIMYMRDDDDLRAALMTAAEHCHAGGVVLVMPDYLKETFRPGVHHGGHDGAGRALRHFEWTFDADPGDRTYTVDFVYLLREGTAPVRVVHDRHVCGLFGRDEWARLLGQAGFTDQRSVPDPWARDVFVALRATS